MTDHSLRLDFRALRWVLLATLCQVIALGTVIPLLPFQLMGMGLPPATAPLIYTVFSAAALICAPLWGWVADKKGRKFVLLVASGLTILSYIFLDRAETVTHVFLARAMAGGSAGWLATAQAFVADRIEQTRRARALGWLGMCFGLGFAIGPGIGVLFAETANGETDFHTPYLIAMGV